MIRAITNGAIGCISIRVRIKCRVRAVGCLVRIGYSLVQKGSVDQHYGVNRDGIDIQLRLDLVQGQRRSASL